MKNTTGEVQINEKEAPWTMAKEVIFRERHPRESLLADDLVQMLNGKGSLAFYRKCAIEYDEPFLRKLAAYVNEIPDDRILNSRGAIFCSLLKKWGQSGRKNSPINASTGE